MRIHSLNANFAIRTKWIFTKYITFLFALSEDLKSFLGYIGDKIGFKIVLAVTLFSAGLSATAFDWTPRFNEYYKIPTLSLMENNQSQK